MVGLVRWAAAVVGCGLLVACGTEGSENDPATASAGSGSVTAEGADEADRATDAAEEAQSGDGALMGYYAENSISGVTPCASEVSVSGARDETWSNEGVVLTDYTPIYPLMYQSASSPDGLTVTVQKVTQDGVTGYNVQVAAAVYGDLLWETGWPPLPVASFGSFDEQGNGAEVIDFTVPAAQFSDEPELKVTASWSC